MNGDLVAWRVLDADGNEIGKVDRIVGDFEADIFNASPVFGPLPPGTSAPWRGRGGARSGA